MVVIDDDDNNRPWKIDEATLDPVFLELKGEPLAQVWITP
jgi:hypothetical protein